MSLQSGVGERGVNHESRERSEPFFSVLFLRKTKWLYMYLVYIIEGAGLFGVRKILQALSQNRFVQNHDNPRFFINF